MMHLTPTAWAGTDPSIGIGDVAHGDSAGERYGIWTLLAGRDQGYQAVIRKSYHGLVRSTSRTVA